MKLLFFATVRDLTQEREREYPLPAANLGELVNELCARYGQRFERAVLKRGENGEVKLHPHIIFMINGRDARHLGELAAPLKPDDVVAVFPMVAGG